MASLLVTLAGSGVYGDDDDGTFGFDQTPTLGTPPTPRSHATLPINSPAIQDSGDLGAITHVVFACRVRVQNPLAGADTVPIIDQRIKWQSPAGFGAEAAPESPGFQNNSWGWARTAPITARPAGGAWTWTDISNLCFVGVSATFFIDIEPVAFYVGELDLAEVAVEVWGDAPPPPEPEPSPQGVPVKRPLSYYFKHELFARTGVRIGGE